MILFYTILLFFGSLEFVFAQAASDTAHSLALHLKLPDGKPVSNATVVCLDDAENARVKGISIEGGHHRFLTDPEGNCLLQWPGQNIGLLVANENGFCLAQTMDAVKDPVLILQPWARIEGTLLHQDVPVSNQVVCLEEHDGDVGLDIRSQVDLDDETTTDARGHFVFEHVPAMALWIDYKQPRPDAEQFRGAELARLQEIDVEPGETKRIQINSHGRTVVGRFEFEAGLESQVGSNSFDGLLCGLRSPNWVPLLTFKVPKEFDAPGLRAKWYSKTFHDTPEGRKYLMAIAGSRGVLVNSNGEFTSLMVAPGDYVLSGQVWTKGNITAGVETTRFTVPDIEASTKDTPVNTGAIKINGLKHLEAGDAAPEFELQTLDKHPTRLSDFKGKYVLLDFWATWCRPCVAETPFLKQTYTAFGQDKRFIMVSLSDDYTVQAVQKFVAKNGIGWLQVFLDSSNNPKTAGDYGIYTIPQIMLLGPDGKIIARDLRGEKIKATVAAALRK